MVTVDNGYKLQAPGYQDEPSPPPPRGNFGDYDFLKAHGVLIDFLMSALWPLGRLGYIAFLNYLPFVINKQKIAMDNLFLWLTNSLNAQIF